MLADRELICHAVRERFGVLATPDPAEQALLDDQSSHRETGLFAQLRENARDRARAVPR